MKPQAMPGALHGLEADKPTHDAIASMCGLFVGSRAGVLGRPQLRHHSASREKQSIKTLLERAASFYSPIFPPLDPASKPLLHYIPGTNVWVSSLCLPSPVSQLGCCTFSLRHFVPSDTAAPTPPRAVGISVIR